MPVQLSSQQLNLLKKKIQEEGVDRIDLQGDMLDHIGCAVEEEMARNQDFETAFKTVWENFCPSGGLIEIQTEINQFSNYKIMMMKKAAFLLTSALLLSFFAGSLLNGIQMNTGYVLPLYINVAFVNQYAICLVVIPLYWFYHYKLALKEQADGMGKTWKFLLFFIGFLCAEALINAVFFKMMHMPGGNQLFMIGGVLGLIYTPLYMYRKYRLIIVN